MEKVKEKEKSIKSPLVNKKVTIALVKRAQSSLYANNVEAGTLVTGGRKGFACPVDAQTGTFVDPLTPDEREWLEQYLGIDLNVHKKTDNFWATKKAMVILKKTGRKTESANLVLDLSNPYHYIYYKIALINPRVANTWGDRDNRLREFVIIDGEVQLEDELNFTNMEDEVQEYLLKHKNSKKKLFDLLRLYGVEKASKQVNYSNSTEWIYNELKKASRKEKEVSKLYQIIKLGEKDIAGKIFLEDCITIGLVEKRGTEYRLKEGDRIANGAEATIRWFEDKRNSSVKLRFDQEIEEYYDKHK